MSADEHGPDESPAPAPRIRRTTRIGYDAVLATFVAVLAVAVSAYTAYVQRQQVRAQVWPMLELTSGNEPYLQISLANKGVGPALIKNVFMTADGVPVVSWRKLMEQLCGPGTYSFAEDDIHDRVISAGEGKTIFFPHDRDHPAENLKNGPEGTLGGCFNKGRFKIGVEICYCSTLDDCWTLVTGPEDTHVTETPHCPARSDLSFRQ